MSTEKKANCPHCGNRTMLDITHTETVPETLIDETGQAIGSADTYYYVVKCKTCDEISLFTNWEHAEDPGHLEDDSCRIIYPVIRALRTSTKKPSQISRWTLRLS